MQQKKFMKPCIWAALSTALALSLPLYAQGTKSATPSSQTARPAAPAAQTPRPTPQTARQIIVQGLELYRQGKFDLASKKFMAALKLEPENDEALGYGSLTAYQLGNQAVARELFHKRAELPNQKPSVRTYCTYMVALTEWREARELVARRGEIVENRVEYKLPENEAAQASELIANGLSDIEKALALKPDYLEAKSIKSLLLAESAALETDPAKAANLKKKSLAILKEILQTAKSGSNDFGSPTLRVGEFGSTDDEQSKLSDPELKLVHGGRPLTREVAYLPVITVNPTKGKTDGAGVGPGGGAVSVGPGQGALRSSKQETVPLKAGKAKVEVLISTAGKVEFARILDGPGPTTAAAIAAAKKWTFSPPVFEGHPVQLLGVITFDVQPPPTPPKPGAKTPAQPAPQPDKGKIH